MLLNGNCSWSYKSLKVINNHKTGNESNGNSPFLIQNSEVTLQNKAGNRSSNDRVSNSGKCRSGKDSMKRKFFDLEDSSPEVQNSIIESSYDFDEFNQTKATKKPRKRAATKKTVERGNVSEIKPKRVRPPRTKKKVDYAEWDSHSELGSDKSDTQIKFESDEQDSQACLDKKNNHIKYQLNDEVGLPKSEKIKLQSDDKASPISMISTTDKADDESDCSEDGFVFQTRFSDKNATVVDITNSIESDSVEASQPSNAICDNASLLISKVGNQNEKSEEMTKLVPSDADRILSIDNNPHVVYLSKLEEPNGGLESESSSLSPSELVTDRLDIKEKNIEIGEVESELNSSEKYAIRLEDEEYEKCNKINREIKEMYDKLERDIFKPDEELETISFKENTNLEKGDRGFKAKKPEIDINNEKDYAKAGSSELMIKDRKSEKRQLFELTKEKNIEHSERCNDNKANSSRTKGPNKETDKTSFNTIQSTDNIDPNETLSKTKIQALIPKKGTYDDFLSDDNFQLVETNISIQSSNSSEIFSPELRLKNSLSDNLNIITESLSETQSHSEKVCEIQNISKEDRNINNQWENSFKDFSNEKIDLKLKSKLSSENKFRGKNTKSTKCDRSPISAKSTKTLKNGKKFAVPPKVFPPKALSKENENKQQIYKSPKAEEDNVSKPKTWEDLESKLLMEIDNNTEHEALAVCPEKDFFSTPKRVWDVKEDDNRRSDIWEEKRELKVGTFFEISQYKRSKRVYTSKKNQLFTKKHAANKSLSHVSNQVSALESPSISIINKAIAAMNRSTAEYFSKNEGDSFGSWSENSNLEVQGTEYSYSILSATIQTSGKKLNLTEERSKYIQNINDANRNNLELRTNKPTEEENTLNENIFSLTTKQAVAPLCKVNRENLTLETSVKGKKASKKAGNAKISRKKGSKNDISSLSVKHTEYAQNGSEDANIFTLDYLDNQANSIEKISRKKGSKNDTSSSSLKHTEYAQDGSEDENILTLDYLDNEANSTEKVYRMDNSNTNSNQFLEQHYSLRKRKSVTDINQKKTNIKKQNVFKEKERTYFNDTANENKASLKNDFSAKNCLKRIKRNEDSMGSGQSEKNNMKQLKSNETTKQLSPKDEYIKYLKNLFQNDTAQETNNSGESCNNEQRNTSQEKQDGTKFLMKQDDLFSISSDDFEKDETGYCSEASGLFYDVLDEY